jgi:glycosyltransferase involved in cell wall biosynthesis
MSEGASSAQPAERKSDFLLSVVLPIYNEEACARECIRRLQATMKQLGCRYELLFVNDGSTDQTLNILRDEKSRDPSITILTFSRNFGHQPAISAGLDHATGDAVVILDSDLQDPPEFIIQLVGEWQKGFDVVHAQRRRRVGESAIKKILAHWYYRFLSRISEVELPVDVGDFRLISRRAADIIKQMRESHRYIRGMMCWVGFSQITVQYDRDPRFSGQSKFSLTRQFQFAMEGLFSFSTVPMRLAMYLSLIIFLIALVVLVATIYACFHPIGIMPIWGVVLFTILFIGGSQLLCLGLLGEYIGYTYAETKRRPLYVLSHVE